MSTIPDPPAVRLLKYGVVATLPLTGALFLFFGNPSLFQISGLWIDAVSLVVLSIAANFLILCYEVAKSVIGARSRRGDSHR